MEKFKNKYRIGSARAPWWDYGQNAAYFITICTKNRIHYFGEIIEQKMCLSPLGECAESCWNDIPNHFPFVKLGVFVVMPNHVHGIIMIDKDIKPSPAIYLDDGARNKFDAQSKNIASIIRGFKIGVTKKSKLVYTDFKWQSRFHDHIIRNDIDYQRINDYIENNPLNWRSKP